MAGVRRYEDFAAWQLADALKTEVFSLVKSSPAAQRHFRFRDQLTDAASGISKHIAEGFLRFAPLDFARFLDYGLGSLVEAERWLHDGVELRYFTEEKCRRAFWLAKRCFLATLRLKQSQLRYAARQKLARRSRSKPKKDDKNQVPGTRRTRRTRRTD